MCGRFETTSLTWKQIHDQLDAFTKVSTAPLNLEPNGDVRPTTRQLACRIEDGAWTLELKRWGLVPGWRSGKPLKDTEKGRGDGFKLTTFNARTENFAPSAKRSAVFADSYAKRRCLVPASAWFEWTGPQGSKTKHRFARADGGVIWFAGIWDRVSTPDAGDFASFTILTGPSAGRLADYHDRAPVILEPDEWGHWLDPARDAGELLGAVRPERFEVAVAA